eukprot:COSAG02_NODE_731_length_17977_cov_21.672838_6_plen_84_part_00
MPATIFCAGRKGTVWNKTKAIGNRRPVEGSLLVQLLQPTTRNPVSSSFSLKKWRERWRREGSYDGCACRCRSFLHLPGPTTLA